jgi:D-alanyl-D-alanine carboxypeptidase
MIKGNWTTLGGGQRVRSAPHPWPRRSATRRRFTRLLGLILLSALAAALRQGASSVPAEPVAWSTTAEPVALGEAAEPGSVSVETLLVADDLSSWDGPLVGQVSAVATADGVAHMPEPAPLSHGAEQQESVAPPTQRVAPNPTEAQGARPSSEAKVVVESPPLAPRRGSDAPPPAVTASYVAILDEASGEVLHGQGEHTRVAPASVTKIATTLVALEREPDLGRRIPVTISGSAMAARDGSSIMGLEPGRQVSLTTLLYGMMLPSGIDAAEQVALALGGSREAYVDWMNQKVADLGLEDTHFANPSGMDADGQYSSAYDMAFLGRAAMRNETFRQMAGAPTYRGDGYSMANLNKLIGALPGADGIKIGRTRAAGRTIVASATAGGRRVYVSLFRSQDLASDSTALFNWVWHTFEWAARPAVRR